MNEQIDDNLRRVYRESTEEELPDRFRDLLERLRAQESDEEEAGSGRE